MTRLEPIKAFVGKTVIVRYNLPNGRTFRYEGIILDITDVSIVLDDFKIGSIILPLASCNVTEVKNGH